ncbi:MAG: hypothetical protein ACK2U5_17785 [Candidatus Promineifilaceae bacterium]|jgi:hypothetical protein
MTSKQPFKAIFKKRPSISEQLPESQFGISQAPWVLLLALIMFAASACGFQPPNAAVGAVIEDVESEVKSVAGHVASDPSSYVRDFRVLEPSVSRTPMQMDLNAGYYQGVMKNTGEVSFIVKGEFPHSILLSWVIYDANGQIYSAVNDQEMAPDPENVNPFLSGELLLATNRSYTAFFAPKGAAVPDGVPQSNMLTLPPAAESDRIYITMRSYWPQPGFPRDGGPAPTIEAVSAANPTETAVCPGLGLGEGIFPLAPFTIPAPEAGKILFFRPPNDIIPLADGTQKAEPNDCTGYALAQLSGTDLNLIKILKLPSYPDNQNLTETSVWSNDFEVRYVGLESNGASVLGARSDVAMNDMKVQPDGSAIILTYARPSELTANDRLALLALAETSNWNLMISASDGQSIAPFMTYRNKLAASGFDHSISAIPCFGPDKGDWSAATTEYASNPQNMGEYYIDGAICSIEDVLSGSCAQQLADN